MDKINKVVNGITGLDHRLMDKAQERLDNLTKPLGSLGRLEELAKQVVGITAEENPTLKNKVIFTLAADHGATEEGISAFPKEVTAQMVYNFLGGGAGINVLAKHVGARVVVVDIGVAGNLKIPSTIHYPSSNKNNLFWDKKMAMGTNNFAKGPAMSRDQAVRSIEVGIEVFEEEAANGLDIAGTGEMGIGNTTAASAITAVFTKALVEDITGRGTGINEQGLKNKIRVIKDAIRINKPDSKDAIDVLAKVGGFEIGGLAGIILAAASRRKPVVIDGFISGAAALIAYGIEPKTKEYMIASHSSAEKGHKVILDYIGLKPLLDLDLRLGEGTGAALGINIIEAGIKVMTEMATFKSAGVSIKENK
ncbi:MAG: nicotinate-nucleotide--dimethylbenzimidazole phosphoribosyltransferase [Candidatus Omnitrophota bacterium]|nr:nicotinate-nucleotide--dimethylbenzimidazole phosphoribosyltransferase [Candidatus Omnitrophota bacterium]MBU1929650.1 nicotinate-nucleotide--dimethylbenzimidazole phosphoribosyltransferase [Candidatus Omnitrophota bacterium]MBU2035394.1 nicotinate-nucleotide--dimethylbenzimidazole phosphoribosyltransferase [Candidatus Omnitrophota bacterium]MBU2221764.1 nicotinate-nucleotide--dimethylbenzimidazole phosphoribosyltransferase [Candidatus Omnitrophota bacterium]MBU2258150.1 nicotinate-nucleotid